MYENGALDTVSMTGGLAVQTATVGWLVQYDEAGQDFGIVGQSLFQQTYDRLTVTPELRARLDAMRARVPKK